jgi:hypothetical protein
MGRDSDVGSRFVRVDVRRLCAIAGNAGRGWLKKFRLWLVSEPTEMDFSENTQIQLN